MGYFGDLLKKIETVESQGFDPYTESYSARIGKLPTTTDPTITTQPKTYTAQEVSKSFTDNNLSEPFGNLVTNDGDLNDSEINRVIREGSKLGMDQQALLDVIQASNPTAFNRAWNGQKAVVNNDGGIVLEKSEDKKRYKFEKTPKGRETLYQRIDLDTNESILYDGEKAYNNAREEYGKITGKSEEERDKQAYKR